MFISQTRRDVMQVLRHGPLDHHQLAATLAIPPWLSREALRGLRGQRLVTENWDRRRRSWELTPAGRAIVNAADQLALDWRAGELTDPIREAQR